MGNTAWGELDNPPYRSFDHSDANVMILMITTMMVITVGSTMEIKIMLITVASMMEIKIMMRQS